METKRIEEIAVNRLKLITPLLNPALDKGKKKLLRDEICAQTGWSDRTLRRYVSNYREKDFEGLKPKVSGSNGRTVIPEDVMQEAIALRREVPHRSVTDIIRILEWESLVPPGFLKRSTLQDQLTYRGYSSAQMRTYTNSVTSSARFQKPWRNCLWQADIKFGLHIDKKPTYMVCYLDDNTRFILHSEFYPTLDQKIVQDCFRKALMKYGAPDGVLYDNGKQFRSNWMQRTCGKLGIRLIFCRPRNPRGKGKEERYNQTVDKFLREAELAKPKSLEELNRLYQTWMDECYLYQPHSALGGKTPQEAYHSDDRPLNLLSAEAIANAFLSSEKRKVDKSGCINFMGRKYEVEMGLHMIHRNVDVVYDPADISKVTVECAGVGTCPAIPLVIREHAGERPKLPECFEPAQPQSSRLLTAAAARHEKRQKIRKTAISFKEIAGKEGEPNV